MNHQGRNNLEALRSLRSTGLRESHFTVCAAKDALKRGGMDEAERWSVTEQLCIAQLDCGMRDDAAETLDLITGRFPSSQFVRSRRLEAFAAEERGDVKVAEEIYAELVGQPLEDGGTNSDVIAMKRQAALLRAAGDFVGAIEHLNKILSITMCDIETWLELADVYERVNNLPFAAYCFEEVLLAMPWNYRAWVRAAEVWYSAGELLLARKYFAYAVELSRGSDAKQYASHVDARALVGLCVACRALIGSKFLASDEDVALNNDTYNWASELVVKVIPAASSLTRDASDDH